MGIFFVLLFVPILMQHLVVKRSHIGRSHIDYEKKNGNALAFFFLLLTVLVMFRHETIGNDTKNYIYFFNTFSVMDWRDVGGYSIEIGFSYFNKIVSILSKEPQVFLAITAIITIAMIFPTYKRLCIDSSLTIVLFCKMSTFVLLFSGVRQMLAVGIGFIAYEFTRNKKLFPFIISVIIAITFHTSAFILVVMYPLYHVKITRKWLLGVVPALAFVFIFNRQIFSFLLVFISQFTRFDGEISSTGAFAMLLLFVVFTVFAFLVPDETLLDKETVGLRNFLLFSLVIQMFAPLHSLAMRMNYYYIIFIPLLLPKIVACRRERWNQVAVLGRHIMLLFFFVYFFADSKDGGSLNVFPYHFFWETIG